MSDPAASTWWWWDKWELSLLDMERESSRPKTLCQPPDSWTHAGCKGLLFLTPCSEEENPPSVFICLAHKQSSFERWVEMKVSYTCTRKYTHAYTHTCIRAHTHSSVVQCNWKKNVVKYSVPMCETVARWLDHLGWEARRGMRFVRGH